MNPNREPKMYLSDEQKAIIDKVWEEMRPGVRLHFYELKKRGYRIPHNKIHQYLRETGRTTSNPRKQKKRSGADTKGNIWEVRPMETMKK